MSKLKMLKIAVCGLFGGLINGLFGSGSGMVLVPMLRTLLGKDTKKAHATSVAIVLCLSCVSVVFYLKSSSVSFKDAYLYIIGGVLGAPLGALLLKKIPEGLLRRAFGLFMIYSAVRILIK